MILDGPMCGFQSRKPIAEDAADSAMNTVLPDTIDVQVPVILGITRLKFMLFVGL